MKNSLLAGILFAAFLGLCWFLFYTTAWDLNNTYHFLKVAAVKLIIILTALGVLSLAFFIGFIRPKDLNEKIRNSGMTVYAFLAVFLLLEGVFIFVAQSQVAGTTLAYKRWMDYYWHPINEIGFRDRSVTTENLQGKIRIFALGDSFTAGHGIQRIEDRFPDRFQTMLPDNYRVMNLGRDGVDTSTELYRLYNFPIKPHMLIFQYYGNDIEGVCVAAGREEERDDHFVQYRDYPEFSGPAKWLVKNSYLLNFAYWQLISRKDVSYFDFVIPCYTDPNILTAHIGQLQGLVHYTKKENIPMVVVLFPFMLAIDESEFYMEGVRKLFSGYDIPVIDVGELSRDIPPKKRIVGKLDTHAHPRVHARIADELYRIFKERNYIP